MKIQTDMVFHARFRVINIPVLGTGTTNLWSPCIDILAGKQGHRRMQRTVTIQSRVTMDGGDSPKGQGTAIDGLLLLMRIWTSVASIKPPAITGNSIRVTIPCWISGHCCCWRWAVPVVHDAIDMGVGEAVVHHSRLQVSSFRVLAFPFVCVLVAT